MSISPFSSLQSSSSSSDAVTAVSPLYINCTDNTETKDKANFYRYGTISGTKIPLTLFSNIDQGATFAIKFVNGHSGLMQIASKDVYFYDYASPQSFDLLPNHIAFFVYDSNKLYLINNPDIQSKVFSVNYSTSGNSRIYTIIDTSIPSKISVGQIVRVKFHATTSSSGTSYLVLKRSASSAEICRAEMRYRNSYVKTFLTGTIHQFVYMSGGTDANSNPVYYWDLIGEFDTNTDTKNTAGITETSASSSYYLVGSSTAPSTSTSASAYTFANTNVYMKDGALYSNDKEVSTVDHSHTFPTPNNGTLTLTVNKDTENAVTVTFTADQEGDSNFNVSITTDNLLQGDQDLILFCGSSTSVMPKA